MRTYMSIDAQVDADFTRARHRSLARRMGWRLRGDPSSADPLLSSARVAESDLKKQKRLQQGPPRSEGRSGGEDSGQRGAP